MAEIPKSRGSFMSVDPAEAVERNRPILERIRDTLDDASAVDIESALIAEETSKHVRRALDELDARDADILRAVFIEERSKDEICQRYGVDRAYLRVLLHQAKEHFRARLAQVSSQAVVEPSKR